MERKQVYLAVQLRKCSERLLYRGKQGGTAELQSLCSFVLAHLRKDETGKAFSFLGGILWLMKKNWR